MCVESLSTARCLLMMYIACKLLRGVVMEIIQSDEHATQIKDYCPSENFEATCPPRHVVLMTHARYGRMKVGRCISDIYGEPNCAIDVLQFMEEQCSGRQSCSVYVSVKSLHQRNPCDKNLNSYLEAAYKCVPVAWASRDHCSGPLDIEAGTEAGYIASYVTVDTSSVGTQRCPWKITAPIGQTVELSLYAFGTGKTTDGSSSSGSSKPSGSATGSCLELGTVKVLRNHINNIHSNSDSDYGDNGNTADTLGHQDIDGQEVKILACNGNRIRESILLHAQTNRVQVTLVSSNLLKNVAPFLIKYEVRGCPQIVAPPGGSVHSDGMTAVVTCNKTRNTWYFTCANNQWNGQAVNCSADSARVVDIEGANSSYEFPIGILLIVAIGVALGVFLGGILLTLVAMHMKKKHRKRPSLMPREDYYETYKLKEAIATSDNKSLDPSLYYGLTDDAYNSPSPRPPYRDCPAHGHLFRDHVTQHGGPDVCNEHKQHPVDSNMTLYEVRHTHPQMRNAYEHLNEKRGEKAIEQEQIPNNKKTLVLI